MEKNKTCINEFVSSERGTIVVSDGKKLLVNADRKWFYHGVEILFTVVEEKDTYSIIDVESIDYTSVIDRICILNGLSPKEAQAVKTAYAECGDNRKVFSESLEISEDTKKILKRLLFGYSFLRKGFEKVAKYGVTFKALEENFERFGFRTFIKLSENPYDCVGQSMGFNVATNIFFSCSSDMDMKETLASKKLIDIMKAEKQTWIDSWNIESITARYGAKGWFPSKRIASIMEAENLLDPELKQDYVLAFKEMAKAERDLATLIKKSISSAKPLIAEEKIDRLRTTLKKEGVSLSTGQSIALSICQNTGTACLTGGPGTGKTTVVKNVLRVIEENIHNIVIKLAAPTGKAAKRLSESSGREAVTVHRLLEMDQRGSCRRNEQKNLEADVIVIDEASMLDTVLTLKLYKALPEQCLLLLVGDVNQLPPVEAGQVFSDLIKVGHCPIFRLYETMRQKNGSILLDNINKIRDNRIDLVKKEGEFEEFEFDLRSKMYPSILQRAIKEYKKRGLSDFQLLVARHEGNLGTKLLNAKLQFSLNPNKRGNDSPFVKGDKIIFTKNNYKSGYLNGDIGFVVDSSDNGMEVSIVGGSTVFIPLEEYKYCDLAYAITVHKSQGSEYPCAMVTFGHEDAMMLTRNWFYTAVSRAKECCLIYKEKGCIPSGNTRRNTVLPFYL